MSQLFTQSNAVLSSDRDIEDRHRLESLFAMEKRTLEMIAAGAILNDVLDDLCRAVDAHAPDAKTIILLMDPDGHRLWPAACPKVHPVWRAALTPLEIGPCQGSCGTAAYRKKRVIVSDVMVDPVWPDEYRSLAMDHGVRASWSEPLMANDGEVLGTFAMCYSEPRSPHASDLDLIEGVGNIARIAIERQRSQIALRKALDQIRKSEAQLRKIIDTIPVQAWRGLPDGSIDYLNQRWHDYTGVSAETAHGEGWKSAVHPDDLQNLLTQWVTLLGSGEAGEMEARLRRFDGAYRWFIIRLEPLHDETGQVTQWYGTNTDVDDLKRAEEKHWQQEQELRRMINAIPQHIVVLSPGGVALDANESMLKYTGLMLEEVRTTAFRARIFHPDDWQRLTPGFAQAFTRELPFQHELRVRSKDGRYRWALLYYNPLRDEQGCVIRWYATGTDIHERKEAEERTRNENLALREEIDHSSMFEEIVGSSQALRQVLSQVMKVARTDSTVLILGETGTGKELMARAIHRQSRRSKQAFIGVNCAAIPSALLASELFGHEKGAFTGALQRRLGRFESADGGTIFLDEIGDLPLETQVTLLRVLQEREFERVGSSKPSSVDVRVVAATNRDLAAAVAAGTFREDLFYRLNVFPITLPSLRERASDIPLLAEYLIGRYAKRAGKTIRHISRQTMELFQAYQWPGNIRELQNIVERAVILCDSETLSVESSWLRQEGPDQSSRGEARGSALKGEREKIEAALAACRGIVGGPKGAAARLGLPRQTLDSKTQVFASINAASELLKFVMASTVA